MLKVVIRRQEARRSDRQLSSSTNTTGTGSAATEAERRVIDIIRAKAVGSGKIHCGSNVRLGGRKLSEWLDPDFLAASQKNQTEFIRHLAAARFWVHRGSSEQSRLVRELSWGGRMFGAFTNAEVDIVRVWIESLGEEWDEKDSDNYWSFTERPVDSVDETFSVGDVFADYATFLPSSIAIPTCLPPLSVTENYTSCERSISAGDGGVAKPQQQHQRLQSCPRTSKLGIDAAADVTKLLPLWFTHTCLLQPLVSVPFQARTGSRCAVLRLLRAQAGFDAEGAGVAGMDEIRRGNVVGLVELGLQMVAESGLGAPRSPAEAIGQWPSEFGAALCRLSVRPNQNAGLLIGLTWAFVDLHDVIASAPDCRLLPGRSCTILSTIARQERECLVECIDELKGEDRGLYEQAFQGHAWGSNMLLDCFQ